MRTVQNGFVVGVIVLVVFLALLSLAGCAVLPPIVSATGGWYTHDRIDRLETGRIEELEKRMGLMEERE